MKKLIAPDWVIDLTPYRITETDNNAIFSDTLFSKITLPFTIVLNDEIDINLGFISSYNTNPQTIYDVYYQDGDNIYQAKFEVLGSENGELSVQYEYGLDEFPSWNKKLSELSLHNFDLPTGLSIYDHANAMIDKVFPEVDYCWPMIHADYIDTTDEVWENFEGILNKRVNGQFIQNSINATEIVYYHKNYMQPVPFWLYLLKKGIEDGGYTLKGDILTDPVLLKKTAFSPRDYFNKKESESTLITRRGNETPVVEDVISGEQFCFYENTTVITKKGKYLLQGRMITQYGPGALVVRQASIEVNNNQIFYEGQLLTGNIYPIEIYLDVTTTTNLYYGLRTFNAGEELVVDLELILLFEYDNALNPIPNIRNLNKVNLKEAVPDITFGEFVNITRNWHNYTFDLVGKDIWMNKVESAINSSEVIDLSDKEIKYPAREFQQGISFLLKFMDVDVKKYIWDKVFQNVNGYTSLNYTTDSKTNPIEINAIPLPYEEKSTIKTAVAFEKDDAKVYALFYEGLVNGKNVATDPTDMLLPARHLERFKKWFDFRIASTKFKWTFATDEVKAQLLTAKSKIYAYKNQHLIKSISKTQNGQSVFEIEIETQSIK